MTSGTGAAAQPAGRGWIAQVASDRALRWIVAAYLVGVGVFGSCRFDIDEFRVIKEPYEMFGGDYTIGYLRSHELSRALGCAARAYAFYWRYRPLSSPIIDERDRQVFASEERRFGYTKPGTTGLQRQEIYEHRLIVPEPDRFYRHGAGAPLLTAVLRIPSLALVRLLTARGPDLLHYQFHSQYHPIFLVPRLTGILGGLACLLLVYVILVRETSRQAARFGTAILAALPPALMFFPNLHYDAVLAPLVLAASYAFVRDRPVASGICFGLAMAAKNSAVLVLLAAALFVGAEAVRLARSGGRAEALPYVRRMSARLGLVALIGVLAVTPFASPVSQAREILTPLISRPFDPRGEDVSRYSLGRATTPDVLAIPHVVERSEVVRLKALVGYNLSFLFVWLGLPLVWGRLSSPFARYSFWFLITAFPYRMVFGDSLGYRSLMYLPFFAILAVLVLGRRAWLALLGILVTMDVVFAIDPMTANGMPYVPEATERTDAPATPTSRF